MLIKHTPYSKAEVASTPHNSSILNSYLNAVTHMSTSENLFCVYEVSEAIFFL